MQILRSHYKCGSNLIPHMNANVNSSYTWKSICATWPLVEKNLGWRLGNGNSISLWQDNWIPSSGPLLDLSLTQILHHMLKVKVSSVVETSSTWNWAILSSYLPPSVCALIAAIPPPIDGLDHDILAWLPSSNGNFGVSSAYFAFSNVNGLSTDPLFRSIWKWCGLEHIKLFLWLKSLHTNALWFYHHLSPSLYCTYCNEDMHETILHVLRGCPVFGGFLV